jgi:hypothetical protein
VYVKLFEDVVVPEMTKTNQNRPLEHISPLERLYRLKLLQVSM